MFASKEPNLLGDGSVLHSRSLARSSIGIHRHRFPGVISARLLALAALGFTSACGAPASESAPACADVTIDRFKELMVVDEGVVTDLRTKNASNGVWSFRHLIENMAPRGEDPSTFVRSWVEAWAGTKNLNGFPVDRPSEERSVGVNARLLCPWLQRTATNACNDDCSMCADRHLDLSRAPFRTIGIVNRIDLRDKPDIAGAGELRFVFALTDGPADDDSSAPLPMTMNFEFLQPAVRPVKEWATRWHGLTTIPGYGEPYRAKLAEITESVVLRDARMGAPNGSALSQVRTNESAFNWIWQLREFVLAPNGALLPHTLRNTPAEPLNNSPMLRDFVTANAAAVREDKHVMPSRLLGGSADQILFPWTVPGVDEATRHAFARGTCNGCHLLEEPNVDTAFHVSPFRKGVGRLSRHLHDPEAAAVDELGLREASMQRALCGK